MHSYKLRTNEHPAIDLRTIGGDRTEGYWTAVVEAEGSNTILFYGAGTTERESIENLTVPDDALSAAQQKRLTEANDKWGVASWKIDDGILMLSLDDGDELYFRQDGTEL